MILMAICVDGSYCLLCIFYLRIKFRVSGRALEPIQLWWASDRIGLVMTHMIT